MISDVSGPCDVSKWNVLPIASSGRYPKIFLQYGNAKFMIKFAEQTQSKLFIPYHVSEYVSCRVCKNLGYDVQEVAMASFHGQECVLIQLFEEQLTMISGLGSSTLSGEKLNYDLDALCGIIKESKFAFDVEGYMWDTFFIDAFVSNLDRHPNNWGFFKRIDNLYYKAPLYDFGNSLFSLNANALGKMARIPEYCRKYGNSLIKYHGERTSFHSIIQSETSEKFDESHKRFRQRLLSFDFEVISGLTRYWPQWSAYGEFLKKYFCWQISEMA